MASRFLYEALFAVLHFTYASLFTDAVLSIRSSLSSAKCFIPVVRPRQYTVPNIPTRHILSQHFTTNNQIKTYLNVKRAVDDLGPHEVSGKRVIVRCDLNVPLNGTEITDDTRIRSSIKTIKWLTELGGRVVVLTHLGRPKGVPDPKYSVMPLRSHLENLLRRPVIYHHDCIGEETKKKIDSLRHGDVLLLENVRFHPGETANDESFAKMLASYGDLFVNDAFGAAHRAHGSTEGIARYLKPAVAGFLMKAELDFLMKVTTKPARPCVAVIGGSKVSSKIAVLRSLVQKVDKMVIGGGMAFTFLAAQGYSIGSSIVEKDKISDALDILNEAERRNVKLVLPVDVVVADKFSADAKYNTVPVDKIPDGWWGLDIGPETCKEIERELSDAKTVVWNGPMGVFEFVPFSHGTNAVAKIISELNHEGVVTIVGGGDSVAAISKTDAKNRISHVSTGGGATLEFLEGKELPGVSALDELL